MAASRAKGQNKTKPARQADGGAHAAVGERLRTQRERSDVGLRELARQIGISASALSQIETGRSRPSVTTLYRITTALGMSLDELFDQQSRKAPDDSLQAASRRDGAPSNGPGLDRVREGPVQRAKQRGAIELESGVRWELLTAGRDPDVDFLHVMYDVGGASSRDRAFVRHAGREYGLVLTGRLRVTLGFEPHELGPGDSISFESSTPHLLENAGSEPVSAIWVCVGRHDDPRLGQPSSRSRDSVPH